MKSCVVIKLFFCFLITLPGFTPAISQDSLPAPVAVRTPSLDEAKWKELTKDMDFSEEEKKIKPEKAPADYSSFSPVLNIIFKVFIILAGIALITFLILRLSGVGNIFRKDKKIKPTDIKYNLQDLDENPENLDLDTLLQEAVRDRKYALALRLHYLAIIKKFTSRNLLTWKKEKTNYDYLRELGNHPAANSFAEITNIFERTWYGEQSLTEEQFLQAQGKFRALEGAL